MPTTLAQTPLTNSFALLKDGLPILTSPIVEASIIPIPFTCTKLQSKDILMKGEAMTYTCNVLNAGLLALGFTFYDKLDSHIQYITGTFKVDGVLAVPTYNVATNELTYAIPSLTAGITTAFTFDILVIAE